jgi:hypothetical protein
MGDEVADDGGPDPRLEKALASGARAEVLAALAGARVFAGITATSTAEEVTAHGLRAESSAEMAVLLVEVDGGRALPVFSSVAALKSWRLDARPVPLLGPEACRAALDEGAEALLLDVSVTVALAELSSLAEGWVPIAGSGLTSRLGDTELHAPGVPVRRELVAALRRSLAAEGLRAARLLEGPDGLVLGVTARTPLDPPDLAALAQRVMSRLGPELPEDGLGLAQVPRRGPGVRLLRRGR